MLSALKTEDLAQVLTLPYSAGEIWTGSEFREHQYCGCFVELVYLCTWLFLVETGSRHRNKYHKFIPSKTLHDLHVA